MKFICNKIAGISSTIAFAILSLVQPANALIFNWQFTNEDGDFGNSTDVVAGFVEFNDADVFPNATGVAAINLQITSVTGLNSTSSPFFGDGAIELNQNLIPFSAGGANSFDFNSSSQIVPTSSSYVGGDNDGSRFEELILYDNNNTIGLTILRDFDFDRIENQSIDLRDQDSSSLTFTQQASASVPFEFSPTLGLLVVGGVFISSSYIKYRKTLIK